MEYKMLPQIVDWGMGAIIIGVFALVCIALILVVYNMVNKKND